IILGAIYIINLSTSLFSIKEVLRVLGEHFIASLLIEGGGEVNASFIENKLVDKFIIYIAPKIIGGRDAPTFIEGNIIISGLINTYTNIANIIITSMEIVIIATKYNHKQTHYKSSRNFN
ncbi:RibD family protein, partial [Bacillus sp. D-CC]